MKRSMMRVASMLFAVILLSSCEKFPWYGNGHGQPPVNNSTTLYVAVNGNDASAGTSSQPLATLAAAYQKALPGYTILIRGGTYYPSATILLNKSGSEAHPILIQAETSDFPVFNFSNAVNQGDGGIEVKASWIRLKGLVVTKALYKSIYIVGDTVTNVTVEQVTVKENNGTGLTVSQGPINTLIKNCDAYANFDTARHGQNADGFVASYGVGSNTRFVGCRAWNNSDDGFDCWEAGIAVTFENCYTWANGVNIWNDPLFEGNGNGFKLGGGPGSHVLKNCAAWNMEKSGFDLNGNASGVNIDNCTAVQCGKFNFDIYWGPNESSDSADYVTNVLRNNLSAGGGGNRIRTGVTQLTNSWNIPISITPDDFKSVDPASLQGARGADGSLPTGPYLQLASGSLAIDAGSNVGLPFNGTAPDLGAFESGN